MNKIRRLLVAVALCSGLLAAVAPASGASGWAQFGGKVAIWDGAHAADPRGCPSGPCYGPRVHSGAQPFEFTHITTGRGRVDGYDEAIPDGTEQSVAVLKVMSYLPPDTTTGTIVAHHDRFGESCAYVNLQSKTLKAWFGPNLLSGGGVVGLELVTVLGQGRTTYNPSDVNLVLLAPRYLGSDDNC